MEHIGQPNQLSADGADHRTTAETRNRDIVGQHNAAARGSGVFDKGQFVVEHVGGGTAVDDEADGAICTDA